MLTEHGVGGFGAKDAWEAKVVVKNAFKTNSWFRSICIVVGNAKIWFARRKHAMREAELWATENRSERQRG